MLLKKKIPFEEWEDFIIESINKPSSNLILDSRRSENAISETDYFKIVVEDS